MTKCRQSATLASRSTGPPLPLPLPLPRGPGPAESRSPAPNTWRAPAGPPPPPPPSAARLVGEAGIPVREVQFGPGRGFGHLCVFPEASFFLSTTKRAFYFEKPGASSSCSGPRRAPLAPGCQVERRSGPEKRGRKPEARSPAAEARLEERGRWRRLQPAGRGQAEARGPRWGRTSQARPCWRVATPAGPGGGGSERRQSSEAAETKEVESHAGKTCEAPHVPRSGAWWQSGEAMRCEAACVASLGERLVSSSQPPVCVNGSRWFSQFPGDVFRGNLKNAYPWMFAGFLTVPVDSARCWALLTPKQ